MNEFNMIDVDAKLAKILYILEGSPHQAGLVQRVERTEEVIHGKDGGMGILGKVNVMWRLHVWAVGIIGICIGVILKSYIH